MSLNGALLEISPQQLAWTYLPDAAFPGSDEVCGDPYIGPIAGVAGDVTLHARFAHALKRVQPGFVLEHQPYLIDCRLGGRWGPGQVGTSYLYRGREGTILMSWYGDTVLLLNRLDLPKQTAPARDLPIEADDATD